ncbi:MAG: hypothetical protein RMJ44_00250 [Cytophagales bacterium]|nr:hypothetical protein [Bernardetiaceae bacterium]MDW8209489.1 hypothetical protein [Cytophagales bacterium]
MNEGFHPERIAAFKQECKRANKSFLYVTDDLPDEDSAHFRFVGKHNGKEVIYDAFIYTLRSEYEMAVFDLAEQRLKEKFPEYIDYEHATEDQLDYLDLLVDEIEAEEEVGVSEFVEIDEAVEFGVAIDICLNVEKITDEVIEKFVRQFNDGTLALDDTIYSFSYASENNRSNH